MSPPAEPSVAVLGGAGLFASLRRSWLATRPQFLTGSALPVLVGTAWGAQAAGNLDGLACLLALVSVALMHAASNVWNDVGDERCGSDRFNDERIYPFTGGSRFIQNGVLSVDQMTRLSATLATGAVCIGVLLVWRYGWPVLALGGAGAGLGLLYSWPPAQLAGRGFGEFAVALAFGVLPVCGAAWLQQSAWDPVAVWLGLPVAAWISAVLLINEVPDRQADARAGKRTLPVRLGVLASSWVYAALQLLGWVGVAGWSRAAGLSPWPLALFAVLALPALLGAYGWSKDPDRLPGSIRTTLAVHAAGCIGLVAWIAFAA
jgi:1,4-dihydroxy-2-naphthoate octaprenyltransferase